MTPRADHKGARPGQFAELYVGLGQVLARALVERVVGPHELGMLAAAQQRLWSDWRLAVEPAAALGAAALWSGAVVPAAGERVVLLLCGANLDPATLA